MRIIYVCTYVGIHYVCKYVCMCVCMCVCMYACMHACMHVCMHVCIYVYIYICKIYISGTEDHERTFLRAAAIIVIIFAAIRSLFEAVQLVGKRLYYFLEWENWMELFLFVASVIFVSSGLQSGCLCPESWQWQLGSLALFIAWLNMVLFLKKFPLTGIYVLMFVDVFQTFMRMILLSILFVVSFGIAFYMLFFRPVRT